MRTEHEDGGRQLSVATYRRVSSASQVGEDRYGLDTQQADLDRYVAERGHTVVAQFEDLGISGAEDETGRPGIFALLEAASTGAFEAVIVPAWSRLARDAMYFGWLRTELKRRGVRVLSATQGNGIDATAKLIEGVMAAIDEYERAMLKQKLLSARKIKRSRGGYAGGTAPFGTFARAGSKRLHRSDAEFTTLCRMKQMREAGATLQAIADAMNASGLAPRNGGVWRPGTVQTALRGYQRAVSVVTEAAA